MLRDEYKVLDNFVGRFLAGFRSNYASLTSCHMCKVLRVKKITPHTINMYLRNLKEVVDARNRVWEVVFREKRRNGLRIFFRNTSLIKNNIS